jgi:hypothetical protein
MLTISAIINTVTPSDNDDNRMLKPITLSIDLNKLTLKCGVSLLLNLLIFNYLMLVDSPGLEPGLFWTKTRRVANYTTSHYANLIALGKL